MDPPEFVDGLPEMERNSSRGKWAIVLEPLTQRPGTWAVIGRYPKSNLAHNARRNLVEKRLIMPRGEWEFACRTVEGEYRLYGRFLGES